MSPAIQRSGLIRFIPERERERERDRIRQQNHQGTVKGLFNQGSKGKSSDSVVRLQYPSSSRMAPARVLFSKLTPKETVRGISFQVCGRLEQRVAHIDLYFGIYCWKKALCNGSLKDIWDGYFPQHLGRMAADTCPRGSEM